MRSFCVVFAFACVLTGIGIASLALGLYEVKTGVVVAEQEKIRQLEEKVRFLVNAIENYCDNPGCNIPARAAAIEKLRWAASEAKK